jgi:radical SAM protein with 4Fe4S-binding SPASM domain
MVKSKKFYYLNPSVIVRYEPSGAIIMPSKFYLSPIFIDKELSLLIRQKKFPINGLTQETVENLIKNEIIVEKDIQSENYREIFAETDNLPIHAFLEVTARCNCDCITCYHKEDLDGYEPPLKDVLKRIDCMKNMGIGLVEITGGEALLRDDICSILEKTTELGMNFYIVTNGEYLGKIDKETVSAIKNSLGVVVVSLDGVGSVQDRVRGRPGLYNNIIKGLNFVKDNQIKPYLVSTIHQGNVDCVPKIIAVAKKYKTIVQFRPAVNAGAAKENNLKTFDPKEIFSYLNDKNVLNKFLSTKREIPPSRYYGCNTLKRISIDTRGYIFPCPMDRTKKIEHIEKYNQKTLSRDLVAEVEKMLSTHNNCKLCKINNNGIKCGGFCRFSKSYRNHRI